MSKVSHSGEQHRESAEQKAERIMTQEMARLGWTETDLSCRWKPDPDKLALAAWVRQETTLPIRWMAARLHMGSPKSLWPMLYDWIHPNEHPAPRQLQGTQRADNFSSNL